MKNKILKLIVALLLIVALAITLTACENDEDDDEKDSKKADTSSAESTIEALVDAVNDQDASTICNLVDFDALEKTWDEEFDKKEFKSTLKEFFEECDDLEIELGKVRKLEKDKEVLDDLLEYYDSYDEYIEEIEEDYGIKNMVIYTAELEVSEEYEDLFEDSAIVEGKDVIFMTEDDGEYKIVYTRFALSLYGEYVYDYDDYDYDDDEDYNYDYDYEYEVNEEALEYLNENSGKQTGKVVKEIADYVEKNTTYDYSLYVTYYNKEGLCDYFMVNSDDEIKEFKKDIDDSHKYKVEVNPSDYGYCNIDITY